MNPDDPRHGTLAGYQQRCRCDDCREGNRRYIAEWRARSSLAPGDPRHGTVAGYKSWSCRCADCTAATARDRQRWKLSSGILEPGDPRHGTYTGYSNWDCRCDPCKAAVSAYHRARREARKAAR